MKSELFCWGLGVFPRPDFLSGLVPLPLLPMASRQADRPSKTHMPLYAYALNTLCADGMQTASSTFPPPSSNGPQYS